MLNNCPTNLFFWNNWSTTFPFDSIKAMKVAILSFCPGGSHGNYSRTSLSQCPRCQVQVRTLRHHAVVVLGNTGNAYSAYYSSKNISQFLLGIKIDISRVKTREEDLFGDIVNLELSVIILERLFSLMIFLQATLSKAISQLLART